MSAYGLALLHPLPCLIFTSTDKRLMPTVRVHTVNDSKYNSGLVPSNVRLTALRTFSYQAVPGAVTVEISASFIWV
ncbi:hypothetical protein Agabi119p4_8623 [Agaricus bisporus var. burnettii]|uniref:Uncharacterized protein n=1 Tax=Agaricus bisporus var. burnettii TaxID=192524 RepID=A0A8H7EYX5_AGABI|nr:hypothetical protein Agabi119p4_8623 [Agaricus bisporus var. burnettii]